MRRLSRSGKFSDASVRSCVHRAPKRNKQRRVRRLTGCICAVLFMLFPLVSVLTPHRTPAAVSVSDDAAPIPVFLSQGDRGTAVSALQQKLRALGYDPGDTTGVYTLATASAVKAFQEDAGLCSNGICDAAVSACLDAKAAEALQSGKRPPSVPTQELLSALAAAGCCPDMLSGMSETDDAAYLVRRALTLFQRTHGLCGTGEPNEATLCALGLRCGETDTASDAVRDMDIMLLVRALASFRAENTAAGHTRIGGMRGDDLYLLTACAEVLLNRTRSPLFPDTLDAVCAQGILTDRIRSGSVSVSTASSHTDTGAHGGGSESKDARSGSDTALLLRAAENALLLYPRTGTDSRNAFRDGIARGALYVYRAEEIPQPRDAACVRIGDFVFSRRRMQISDTAEESMPD